MKKNVLLYFSLLVLAFTANAIAQTSAVKMNEIWSRGSGENLDWIEIYNCSNAEVDITGYKIYDSGGQSGTKPKMEIPANTKLPAKAYYVIITDIPTTTNPAGFGLSSGGEKVWLEDNAGTVIDTITFTSMTETQTYRRIPDGGAWKVADGLTKGYANSIIVMNEIWARGSGENLDYIELYNSSSAAVNIGGYKIYDSGGNSGSKPKMEIPANTTLAAKGFYVVITDIATTTNPAGFGLSSSGETVWLEDNSGNLIDSVSYLAHDVAQTFSRIPDGGAWKVVAGLTKGTTNSTANNVKQVSSVATEYNLKQNYPNPFNPSTQISFSIPKEGFVSLKVYDLLGKEVSSLINSSLKAGDYKIAFNAKNLTSGIYFYKLETSDFVQMRKMLLMK